MSTEQESNISRGISSVAKESQNNGNNIIVTGLIALLTIVAILAVNGAFSTETDPEPQKHNDEIKNTLGEAPERPKYVTRAQIKEEPAQVTAIQTGQPQRPMYSYQSNTSQEKTITPQERKLKSSILAFGAPSSSQNTTQPMHSTTPQNDMIALAKVMYGQHNQPAEVADELNDNLKATELNGVRASIIKNTHYFLTRGHFLDCVLETAISSDVAGMTSCRLSKDIYSTNGTTLLLERGSRITGQYKSGLNRGKARIFVLWDRVETPNGVIVDLQSPGTDALGRGGHGGDIDTHFFERFGSAIMLSLIDDVGEYLANKNKKTTETIFEMNGLSDAASNASATALENSINIPKTLYKNQGEHINIFVARDIDFRGVYELKAE